MRTYELGHLDDMALLRDLGALAAREREALAAVIAHLAEVDARRLYLPAGYPSMYEYCLRKLGWSEQAALKRVRAARTARRFPAIFDALAEGRLHLTAVVLLAPYLTAENGGELLAAAACRTRAGIEELLARRFPSPDVPSRLEAVAPASFSRSQLSPGTVSILGDSDIVQLSPGTVSPLGDTGAWMMPRSPRPPRLTPVAPERYVLQFTIGKDTYEKLRSVQELLSHQLPSGDVVEVFDRALDALKDRLEKRKFAATAKPRPGSPAGGSTDATNPRQHSSASGLADTQEPPRSPTQRSTANPRYIPARVKRAVWVRDGGQCTFVNASGERCPARRMLEFDHIEPVAYGGRATVEGVRLLCRGHNQHEADRQFGAGFMNEKRERSRRATVQPQAGGMTEAQGGVPVLAGRAPSAGLHAPAAATRARSAAAPTRSEALSQDEISDVMAGLRALGFRASEVRRAVESCGTLSDATLEERMRAALKCLCPIPG